MDCAAIPQKYATASGGAWCVSALILNYMDQFGAPLGRTAIAARSDICPWVASPTFHILDVVPNVWGEFSFNLEDELAHLPGIDGSQIRQMEIELVALAVDC